VRASVRLDQLDPLHPDPLGNAQRRFVLCIDDPDNSWRAKMA
jgi:hypothetical protein